jgi:sialic acid synthase SpsE
MGVNSVEYHYTLDKTDTSFRDNLVSLDDYDVRYLKIFDEKIKALKGSPIKSPTNSEIINNHVFSFRRGCYLNKNISKGEKIFSHDINFLRPYVENSVSPLFFDNKNKFLIAKKDFKINEILIND